MIVFNYFCIAFLFSNYKLTRNKREALLIDSHSRLLSLCVISMLFNEGRKANHINLHSEPHSPHFLVRTTSKSSSLQYYFFANNSKFIELSFLLTLVKTIEYIRVVPWGKLKAEDTKYFAINFKSRRLAISEAEEI